MNEITTLYKQINDKYKHIWKHNGGIEKKQNQIIIWQNNKLITICNGKFSYSTRGTVEIRTNFATAYTDGYNDFIPNVKLNEVDTFISNFLGVDNE